MLNLTNEQWEELMRYRITRENTDGLIAVTDWLQDDLSSLASRAMEWTGAPDMRVLSSIWLRQYAFFVIGHLYLLSKYRLLWKGALHEVFWKVPDQRGNPAVFVIHRDEWERVSEGQAASAIRSLLSEFCAPMIRHLAKQTKVSKTVLWENVWGYTGWMYSMLLQEEKARAQAEHDLQVLFDDRIWEGIEKQSLFQRFVGSQTFAESITHYKRKTCCLYFELPGQGKCPYCPMHDKE